MKIFEVKDRDSMLIAQLMKVWKDSVKETHLFLSEEDINSIEKYVPKALAEIPHLIIAEYEDGIPIAFMGIDEQKLEMLFIKPGERGRGLGRKLVEYGFKEFSIKELGVNEQNPEAKAFYQHMGFQVYKRSETDEQGKPFPILYMKLS